MIEAGLPWSCLCTTILSVMFVLQLLVLLGAVGFILLIACVNVVNLSLAKTFSRQRRSPSVLRWALLPAGLCARCCCRAFCWLSSVVLLDFAYAHSGVRLIMAFLADRVPHSVDVGLDLKVLVFTVLVSVCTGIIAGILPAPSPQPCECE